MRTRAYKVFHHDMTDREKAYEIWRLTYASEDGAEMRLGKQIRLEEYDHVATMLSDLDLERACEDCYYWTNSIDCNWWDEKRSYKFIWRKIKVRSTSVGDVIQADTGETFIVMGVGVKRID
jgi:hypothetical protein